MPWHSGIATRSTGYLWTASNTNDLVDNLNFLAQVNYTEFTADVTISATTVGTANQIVSSGAITYENVPHEIIFYMSRYTAPAAVTHFILRDGTTVLGTLTDAVSSDNISGTYRRVLTPTAASHTYNVAAWVGSSSGTVKAGTGGAAGDGTTFLPGYIWIRRIPT